MKRHTLVDVVICVVVVMVIALTLLPAIARVQRTNAEATCQANIRRWAQALALYAQDHQTLYPTNRCKMGNGLGSITSTVPLTPLVNGEWQVGPDGFPIRFQGGLNWVEALYPYIIQHAVATDQDWHSFLRCPNSQNLTFPVNPSANQHPCTTYVFNINLAELPSTVVRTPEKTLMLRETDRMYDAVCRPINISMDNSTPPGRPFLIGTDDGYAHPNPPLTPMLHANGSYIAFADGHVAWFDTSYFAPNSQGGQTPKWDAETGRLWNSVNTGPQNTRKAIAITP